MANGRTPLPNRKAAGHVRLSERMARRRRNASPADTSSSGGGSVPRLAPRAGSFIQETMKARAKVGTASTTNVVRHPHTPTSTPANGPPTRPRDVPNRWMPCTRGSSDGG